MDCHHCRKTCHAQKSKPGFRLFRWPWRSSTRSPSPMEVIPTIALVGMPNVGKSALFNALTGRYATVSNYPGTTVEVSQGRAIIGDRPMLIIDTPGMYSLLPITDEEKVARDLLLATAPDLVVHIVDAKNLGRMLPLTFQLIETGLPILLVLNMIDEAKQLQIQISVEHLEQALKIPVVMTAAASQIGIRELKTKLVTHCHANHLSLTH